MSLLFLFPVKEIFKGEVKMNCENCGTRCSNGAKFCSHRCRTIVRLRGDATRSLLEAEERMFGQGYDTIQKRGWVKHKLEQLSSGEHDEEMYLMFLRRNG